MRVATRRLRAVLEIFAPCFPRGDSRRCCATSRRWPTRSASGATPTCTSRPWRRFEGDVQATQPAGHRRARRPAARAPGARATRRSPRRSSTPEESDLRGRLHSLADGARRVAMKARQVKGLDPDGHARRQRRADRPRAARRAVSFMPRCFDPAEVEALHDMRIAAKRLRYVLEVTGACLRPVRDDARCKLVKELQDLLGEIHDCDVQLPRSPRSCEELLAEDVAAAGASPKDLARTPNRRTYAGLVGAPGPPAGAPRGAVRGLPELWRDFERNGFAHGSRSRSAERAQSDAVSETSTERIAARPTSPRRSSTSTASCRGWTSTRACSSWPRTRASRCSSA